MLTLALMPEIVLSIGASVIGPLLRSVAKMNNLTTSELALLFVVVVPIVGFVTAAALETFIPMIPFLTTDAIEGLMTRVGINHTFSLGFATQKATMDMLIALFSAWVTGTL